MPTDEELFRARVFSEPIIPVGGGSTARERRRIANALLDYVRGGGGEHVQPLLDFIDSAPRSVYRASLWFNLGVVYRKTGYFTRALEAWEQAWSLLKHETGGSAKLLGDAAVGELSELNARLGRMERLEAIFAEIEERNIRGSATEKISGARAGLSLMKNRPEDAFRCGPFALDRILAHENQSYARPEAIEASRSSVRGMSLPAVQALSREVGLDYQMAKREQRDADFVVPSIVHWRVGHYAALLEENHGRFLIEDLTFSHRLWVSRAALEEESSGYFLVEEGTLARGWRPVDEVEGETVWGKGTTLRQNAQNIKECDTTLAGCTSGACGRGLATYSFHAMMVSLNITDIPVGYAPPRGPRVDFKVTYNQHESFQPTTFTYSNFGPKWTFDYLSYVEDDPSNALADAYVYARGGGQETFANTGGVYVTHFETYAELVQITHNPPVYERRLPDGSVEVFSRSDGGAGASRKVFLSEWRDPQGNALTFEYDLDLTLLRLTKIIDPLGQVTDIFYEHADPYKITKVEDPFGRQATFTYNAEGQLETITDVIGLVSSFEYGLNDFITALVTPYGRTTFAMGEFEVNGRNRWLEATDPLGARERIEYWNQTFFVPGSEDDYEVPWDPNGIVPFGGDPEEVAFRGNDNLEFRNTFYWSKLAMDRHPGDFEKAEILHWLKDLDPNQTSGTLETVTTPERAGIIENRTTMYEYDPDGYLESVSGPEAGATTRYTYEDFGRVETVIDSDAFTLSYDYDAFNRVTTITYPDGTFEETVYDKLDATRTRDRAGRWTQLFYDPLRRMTSTRDALGRYMSQDWCRCGSLDALIDSSGNTTRWERDIQGRFTKETRADDSEWVYVYQSKSSRLETVTDPKGQLKMYDYFLDDNLEGVSYTNEEHETPDVSFTYDSAYNRVDTMVDGTGTTSYAYHPITTSPPLGAGKLENVDGPLANDVISYTYDELGRTESRSIDGAGLNYEYDTLGRVTKETNALGVFIYDYENVTNRLSLVTYPNGQTTSYSYYGNTEDRRLLEIHHRTPGAVTLSKFGYAYDPLGNILTWTQQTGLEPPKAYDFEYDDVDQLRAAIWRSTEPTPTILKRYRYAYDRAGNRTVEQIDETPVLSTYDEMNRLQQQIPGGELRFAGALSEQAAVTIDSAPATVTSNNHFERGVQVTSGTVQVQVLATDVAGNTQTNTYEVNVSGSTKSFTFDLNGNMTGDGTRTFEWDAEDRLRRVLVAGSAVAIYEYDGFSRRQRKTVGGVTTTYVYEAGRVAQERKSSGETLRYYEGPGIDQHLAVDGLPGSVNYYVPDHLGSIVQVTDASGDVVFSREYDPFGRLTVGTNQAGYGFSGRDWDVDAGLYYYRARNYDPGLGKFISEDPIGFESGETNHYSYVSNNPTNFTDPAGTVGSRGGPWHPPAGVRTKCLPTDDCATLQGKMWLLERMISSHQGWDRIVPRPRGGGRHAVEIAALWVQYANCQAQWAAKCAPPPVCNAECKENVKNASATAATLATGYIVYRCIRMVPSLAPPLWWTIPANAVTP